MKYEVLLVNDSSAGEMTDECYDQPFNIHTYRKYIETHKSFPKENPPIWIKLYEEKEFSSLNDFVHSLQEFIINEKVKSILQKFKLPSHNFVPAIIYRNERKLMLKKLAKYENYYWFNFDCQHIEDYYNFIDFSKSEITFSKNSKPLILKLESISELLDIKVSNQKISNRINELYNSYKGNESKINEIINQEDLYGISWRAEKIVMNEDFDTDLDLFSLPIFSSRTYISQRLKNALLEENVSDIKFIETGNNPDPSFILNPKLEISDSH